MRILIADDDANIRGLIKECLRGYICSFREAQNKQEALAVLNKDQIDVVLLDVILHADNGLDILRFINEQSFENPPQVVIMTGNARREIVSDAITLGARAFLTKPFDHSALVERINQVAKLKRKPPPQVLAQKEDVVQSVNPFDKPRSILLVEPLEERRASIIKILKTTAWHLTVCETLAEARPIIEAAGANYLFININMHEDGLSSVELIELATSLGRVGVVALSSPGDTDDLLEAQSMGISDFILEPITFAKLEKSARTLLER